MGNTKIVEGWLEDFPLILSTLEKIGDVFNMIHVMQVLYVCFSFWCKRHCEWATHRNVFSVMMSQPGLCYLVSDWGLNPIVCNFLTLRKLFLAFIGFYWLKSRWKVNPTGSRPQHNQFSLVFSTSAAVYFTCPYPCRLCISHPGCRTMLVFISVTDEPMCPVRWWEGWN